VEIVVDLPHLPFIGPELRRVNQIADLVGVARSHNRARHVGASQRPVFIYRASFANFLQDAFPFPPSTRTSVNTLHDRTPASDMGFSSIVDIDVIIFARYILLPDHCQRLVD